MNTGGCTPQKEKYNKIEHGNINRQNDNLKKDVQLLKLTMHTS